MALNDAKVFNTTDFVSLKNRVRAEMLRRNGSGDLSGYGGSAYDYTTLPNGAQPIALEHPNKIIDPMSKINTPAISLKKGGEAADKMVTLEAQLTVYEAKPRSEMSNSDCGAGCSGMCIATCSTGCSTGCYTGCYTGCTGACKGCDNTCTGGCYTGCYTGCTGGCNTTCTGGCGTACSTACYGSCGSTCTPGCTAECIMDCTGSCTQTATT